MNWDAIGAIGEVVGALAVVGTLGYLALQIRQSNLDSQSAALHQFIDTQTSANLGIVDNPDVAELIDKANKDFGTLTDPEIIRLQFVFYNHFNQWLYALKTRNKALIDKDSWDGVIRGYMLLINDSPAFLEMWKICGSVYPREFVVHVENVIKTGGVKEG